MKAANIFTVGVEGLRPFEFNHPGGSFTTSGALLSHLRGSIGLDFILRWGDGVLQKYNDVPLKKTSFAPNGGKCEYRT